MYLGSGENECPFPPGISHGTNSQEAGLGLRASVDAVERVNFLPFAMKLGFGPSHTLSGQCAMS